MKPLNVLIIEDDDLIGGLLDQLLAAMGHVVCATATTEEMPSAPLIVTSRT
jgi:DNA-binding response OmpR family regulator